MKDALEYYRILQIAPNANSAQIKQSYHDLAKQWHPDYNKDKDTTDVFQKISVAYNILGDDYNRLVYDILSLVYTKDNYPDLEVMTPFTDNNDGVNVQAVNLQEVKAWFAGYSSKTVFKVCTQNTAIKLNAITALKNWLIGWWHPKAFIQNIKALSGNFKSPVSKPDSLRILLHNMIAYSKDNNPVLSARCGKQACYYLSKEDQAYIDAFLQTLNVKVAPHKPWHSLTSKLVQLIFPLVVLIVSLISVGSSYMNLSESELWNLFSKKKEIDYYQRVDFGGRGQSVDDVVVGKIMSIPIDKSDESKLYHLLDESKVMYGPSADFDVIKVLPKGTTVRLTGISPDNVWARVMIDNGETGFVYIKDIVQGIGNKIPFGSSIIE